MKKILAIICLLGITLLPVKAFALFGVGDIVYDPAAVAQLIDQVQKTVKMINELKDIGKSLENLEDWQEIDHINLAGGWNGQWWNRYRDILDRLVSKIESYQNGGAFSDIQIDRIMKDEIYPGYHADWEKLDDFSKPWRNTKKQMLWTKIQMKHAVMTGNQLRSEITKVAESTNDIMDRNMQAVGMLQTVKIGTQMTMNVVKSLELTNFHLSEFLQAYTAQGLEENHFKGKFANALEAAMSDVGKQEFKHPPVPVSPIE